MERLNKWILATFVFLAVLLVPIQALRAREDDRQSRSIASLEARNRASLSMRLALEEFRRDAGNFRKMPPDEVSQAKTRLRTDSGKALESLDETISGRPADHPAVRLTHHIREQLSALTALVDKNEYAPPHRLPYQTEGIRGLHAGILRDLDDLDATTAQEIASARAQIASRQALEWKATAAFSGAWIALVLLLLAIHYFSVSKPGLALRSYAGALKSEDPTQLARIAMPELPKPHAEVAESLQWLASTVQKRQMERHQFLMSIAEDLRGPLLALQNEVNRSGAQTPGVNRALAKISRLVDDLGDLRESPAQPRLEESLVDLREFSERIGDTFDIEVVTPKTSLWAWADPKRLERVIVALTGKIRQLAPSGAPVRLELQRSTKPGSRGIELVVRESSGESALVARRSDEVDVLQHWVGEHGFGIALARKVVAAHGGTLLVHSTEEGNLRFRILLPEERIATGRPDSPVARVASGALEAAGVEVMLSNQAVYLGT